LIVLKSISLKIAALGIAFIVPFAAAAQEHSHLGGADAKLGTVHFQTSCTAKAQPQFDRAVALLHSFEFGPAISGFDAALAADPDCAVAFWGIALSRWGNPFAPGLKPTTALEKGHAAIERADTNPPKTQRERDYIAAVAHLYDDLDPASQPKRVNAYSEAMGAVAAKYPADTEASIFYALSLSMSADLNDKSYAKQLKAGAILEKLFAKQPQHPGLAHYIIHSYDFPPLAPRALNAARSYAKIAPDAPHALHMPSHIFTRVGSWDESIETNIAARAAAKREYSPAEQLHASDYLVYAYLQSGRDREASEIVNQLAEMLSAVKPDAAQTGAAPALAGYYAAAAIPARYALEHGDWAAAAKIEPRSTPIPYADAMSWFARGMGAAHMGDVARARESAKALDEIRLKLASAQEPYWSRQVEIQEINVLAWTSLAEKNTEDALMRMRAAVEKEDATEKSVITPGPIAPARELLGEMLLQLDRPADALKEFETTMAKEPNRFRALYGAARAAKLAGNQAAARKYSAELLKICAKADQPGRTELAEARAMAGAGGTGK
jgi:hypothetical protein